MSVKRPSYATSTTDFSEFPPNFETRREPLQQNNQYYNRQPNTNTSRPMEIPQKDNFQMLPMVFSMDQDFLPQEILFLLSEEDNHIKKYREKADREKSKIKKDVEMAKNEIINMFDDLSMQMQQYIDEHFKRYISIYSIFKEEIIQFKKQKLEAPLNLVPPPPQVNIDVGSNSNLIRELEEMRYKNYVSKVNAYVGELAKARIEGIQVVSRDLLQLTSHDGNLYNSDATNRQLNMIKTQVEEKLILKFGNMSEYIQPLDFLNAKKQQNQTSSDQKLKSGSMTNLDSSSKKQQYPPLLQPPVQQQQYQQQQQQQQQPNYVNPYLELKQPQYSAPIEFAQSQQQFQTQSLSSMQTRNQIQNSHQISGKVNELEELSTINTPHNGLMLCFTHIRDNIIATGSKDGVIKIWENQKLVAQLSGHRGGVCTMAVLKNNGIPQYLASGSDHGDNSIKIWDVNTFQEYNSLSQHSAAVVALLSLEDGVTLVSGSYDKSLLIWNVDESQPIEQLTVHQNAITCLALGKECFISGGLDQQINIWRIVYRGGMFGTVKLERSIKIPTLVCALNCFEYKKQSKLLCGGKDGRIREYDIQSGELIQTMTIGQRPIVEMIVCIEYAGYSVIAMSNRDRNLTINTNGENRVLDTNDQVQIEFGCGVYPKMEMVQRNGESQLLIVSQREENQQIFRFQI